MKVTVARSKGFGVYRLLGFFWISVGIALLVAPRFYPELGDYPMMQNNVPLAGFCFALSVYNMIRWRLMRANEIEREKFMERELRHREERRPIDSTFDFSNEAKPPGGEEKKG